MEINTETKTDEAIKKLLGFIKFKVRRGKPVILKDFFDYVGRKSILDDISFNPIHAIASDNYDLFLSYKVLMNYREYSDDPFFIDLIKIIHTFHLRTFHSDGFYVYGGIVIKHGPSALRKSREISVDFISRLIGNADIADNVLKHPYLVFSVLRRINISYVEKILKKDLQRFTMQAMNTTIKTTSKKYPYEILKESGTRLDSYGKLNAIYLPAIENICAVSDQENKSSLVLKIIK